MPPVDIPTESKVIALVAGAENSTDPADNPTEMIPCPTKLRLRASRVLLELWPVVWLEAKTPRVWFVWAATDAVRRLLPERPKETPLELLKTTVPVLTL